MRTPTTRDDLKEHVRQLAVLVTALLIMASFAISGWALKSRFEQGNQNRSAITEAIRTVLCYARASVQASDPAQRDAADHFYDHALQLIHARPCLTILKGHQ